MQTDIKKLPKKLRKKLPQQRNEEMKEKNTGWKISPGGLKTLLT